MSREDLIRRLGEFHDRHLAYEPPETSPGAALMSKDTHDDPVTEELMGYVLCNITMSDLREWLARDGAKLRLGGAYDHGNSPA